MTTELQVLGECGSSIAIVFQSRHNKGRKEMCGLHGKAVLRFVRLFKNERNVRMQLGGLNYS